MKADIYIIAGQSNAEGYSAISSCPEGKRDRRVYDTVEYYSRRVQADGTVRQDAADFRPVREGLGYQNGGPTIGPELGMARVLAPKYDGKEARCVLVKYAVGGTSLLLRESQREGRFDDLGYGGSARERAALRGTWYPEGLESERFRETGDHRPTGFLLRELKKLLAEAVSDLEKQGIERKDICIRGMAWMQGETDRKNFRDYAAVFPVFAEEIREYVRTLTEGRTPCMPIVMGEISETFSGAREDTVKGNRLFIEMQRRLPESVPELTVIASSGLHITEMEGDRVVYRAVDGWHYTYEDALKLGEMFGEALI